MPEFKSFLSTKEVAQLLHVNEKMVYALISQKGLPATKVTGKWIFPRHLVEIWLENGTINFPKTAGVRASNFGLLIIIGSNDVLIDRLISLYNYSHPDHPAVFGNVGSLGGINALQKDMCHIATSHLIQADGKDYNFDFASQELMKDPPVLVNFCRREQGLIVAQGNPKRISGISDLDKTNITIANRPKGTGTRHLLDEELKKAGINGSAITGYNNSFRSHWDVAMEVFSDRADAALAIKPVSGQLGLDFIPIRWERYDLLVSKVRFFEQNVQHFLGLLHEPKFRKIADHLAGYDLTMCGKIVFPKDAGV